MSGATLKDLTKYHQRAMQYFKNGLVSEQNKLFAQTEEAGAVSFWPLGGTPVEGTVEFMFKETPPVSGEKGPSNPSTISGVSSIECSCGGKNLLYYPLDALTKTIDGVTFTYNNDGSFSVSGTSTRSPVMYRIAYSTGNKSVYSYLPAGTYTLSGCPANGNWGTTALPLIEDNGSVLKDNLGYTVIDYGSGRTFTIDEPKRFFCMMRLGYATGTNISNIVYKPQLEVGSSITALEPANRNKLPLPLGSTYYGGEIDLATGVMTVTHYKVTISAINNISDNLNNGKIVAFLPTGRGVKLDNTQICCNRFPASTDNTIERIQCRGSDSFWSVSLYIDPTRLGLSSASTPNRASTAEDKTAVNAWLANNPIDLVFKATQPTTVQLTPLQLTALAQKDKYTPRMNMVYTDADSIQIRYRKSLIHDEDEKVQAIVALGGNV